MIPVGKEFHWKQDSPEFLEFENAIKSSSTNDPTPPLCSGREEAGALRGSNEHQALRFIPREWNQSFMYPQLSEFVKRVS